MNKPVCGLFLSMLLVFAGGTVQAKVAPVQEAASKKSASKASNKVAKPKRKLTKARAKARTAAALPNKQPSAANAVIRDNTRFRHQSVAFSPSAPATGAMSGGAAARLNFAQNPLPLKSHVALVMDQGTSQVLFEKNGSMPLPVASITKLMTAIVVLEARQPMEEMLEVTTEDIDRERNSSSRLRVGARMRRDDMLHIALMSSENRAASALGRNYPGGLPAFVAAMNAKARVLGMKDTRYVDPTGLSSQNIASARDLAKLVIAAYQHPMIRNYSTDEKYMVSNGRGKLNYINSNSLIGNADWDIGLQKTGYITEAGRCLVMQARIEGRPVVMVFLDSKGRLARIGDASRIRKWLEGQKPQMLSSASGRQG